MGKLLYSTQTFNDLSLKNYPSNVILVQDLDTVDDMSTFYLTYLHKRNTCISIWKLKTVILSEKLFNSEKNTPLYTIYAEKGCRKNLTDIVFKTRMIQ